jgi:hypothetical protein
MEPSTTVHLGLNSRCENLGETKTRPVETLRLPPHPHQSKIRSTVPGSVKFLFCCLSCIVVGVYKFRQKPTL